MKGRGSNNKFGLKRSCSSSSLMQSCPDHCEPQLIVEAHRSCGSSPARCRPRHCHEPANLEHCESDSNCRRASADDQMISYTTSSCPLKSNDRSQHYYPTRNRYFNALDAAAGIRTALQNSQHSRHCVSKNRSLQRLRLLHTIPTSCNQSNSENCNVEGLCIEDHMPQGLATVLCPKFPPDMEFQIQKRHPRGLAAVIADHCSCAETGHQPVAHQCQPCPEREQCQPCPQRQLISLPKLQQFHQEATSSSPRNSRMTTNIDMLEQVNVPPCESVASSRTSIKMQTDMQQQEQQRMEELQRQEDDDSYLDYNYLEPPLRASSRWDEPGGHPNYDRRSLEWRHGSKRKRSMRLASFREPAMRPSSVRDSSMRSSTFRESSTRSASFREPSRQFDPNEEEILHQQLERMSFNDRQEGFPSESPEGYSSWVPDRRSSEPLRLSISVVNESRDPRGQENVGPEDSRRRETNAADGSSKTTMVSLNQSTPKSSNRGSGSTYPEHLRSSDARSEPREIKEVRKPESIRGIVQQAVHEELSMQKAVQKAVQQELNSRSSYSEEQSSESFSPSCTPDDVPKRSRRPSRASSDEQSAYAQIVANARKSQDILDETEAELASKSRSTSRSKSRMSPFKGNGSISTGNADGLARGNSIPLDDESTWESSDQPENTHRKSQKPPPPTGITYKDHMASITQLLNSMNSVTQLLNSMPLQGDPDPPLEARKSFERADCSPSRMNAQPISAPREPSLQTQQHPYRMPAQQSQFDMGAGSPQQPLVQMGGGSFQQPQFDMGARSSQQPLAGMGGGSFQQPQFKDVGARSSQQPLINVGGGSFQQSQFDMRARSSQQPEFDRGGGSFQQSQYDFGAQGPQQPQFGMGVRNSQQPQFDGREGSFQQSQFGIGAPSTSQQPQFGMGASGSSQLQFDAGGGSFQQPQYDMGGRLSQQPQFNSGGQSFQQSQLDVGSMNPNQLPWDMGGGIGQGSYSQLLGQQPDYPNGMPMGPQFEFDPQRPRSQSMPVPQSQLAFDPNNMQQPRSQSMAVGSQFANGWNNIQQSGRRSMDSMNRRPSDSQWRSSSMTGQRGSRRGSTRQYSSMTNQGQRRSRASTSRQSKRMSQGQRRSKANMPNSRSDPNEREMKARSSQVLYNPESEAYEEVMEAGQDVSEAIPEADESGLQEDDVEGDDEVEEGDDEDPDQAQESGESQEHSNDEEGSSSQQAEGMDANYQPTIIQPEKLDDQVTQLLQSQVKQLDGSSEPDLIPTPQAMAEQCDEDVNNPETKPSSQILSKTVDSAKPNVAHMPIEFQHHLIRIHGHTLQHFEFVKPETYGRKSLSSIVYAMFQELEALEARSRQMSAAYEFTRPSSREYCTQKQVHSDIMVGNQEKLQDHLSPEISL